MELSQWFGGELPWMPFVPVFTGRQSRALACPVCTRTGLTQQRRGGGGRLLVVKKQRRDCRQRGAMEP